ncbi:unnamed protein product [Linum tenue]|uniref:CTP synthase n=1 Tax=Linum tenue TaxID=586396 RepID=A0AAV0Q9G5_9ROSI|nr:unnamed protein product [Linum tenue]
MKYVVVTGGGMSGLGKGVTSSSVGVLLQACGLRVTCIKIDPYLNIDAGTMSPFEHGEVFVLQDGGEADLDLGNYERFLDVTLTSDNNITTGKINRTVMEKERRGAYLGKTVQVVPHVTDEIQDWIQRVAHAPVDVCVIELGGTVGDIESCPFVEALAELSYRVGDFCLIHVSHVPVLSAVGEQKTKPTQHSVRTLRSLGLAPNILACRSNSPLEGYAREKLARSCHVSSGSVLSLHDVGKNVWRVPILLRDQKAHEAVLRVLNLDVKEPDLKEWTARAELFDALVEPVRIALVGKYMGLTRINKDAYFSVEKALLHASVALRKKLAVDWVPAEDLEDGTAQEKLKGADGILVPGGFGDRGVEGKILAAKHARENRIPYLGICLGMQVAVIEFARSVLLDMQDANSTEFDAETKNPCVVFMPEGSRTHVGGTMRLGSRRTYFHHNDHHDVGCMAARLYGNVSYVDERHRHRYEVNPEMVARFEEAGLWFSGRDESGERMEIVELGEHPFYVGVQFHPEFKSRPGKPSPVFTGLVAAACGQLESVLQQSHGESNGFEKTDGVGKVVEK